MSPEAGSIREYGELQANFGAWQRRSSQGRRRTAGMRCSWYACSWSAAAAAAKSLQSCPTLCDPHRRQPTRLPHPGILQARILEWVAISFSNA